MPGLTLHTQEGDGAERRRCWWSFGDRHHLVTLTPKGHQNGPPVRLVQACWCVRMGRCALLSLNDQASGWQGSWEGPWQCPCV